VFSAVNSTARCLHAGLHHYIYIIKIIKYRFFYFKDILIYPPSHTIYIDYLPQSAEKPDKHEKILCADFVISYGSS
jgi:hypothetical protein